MIVKTLVENTSISESIASEHGLRRFLQENTKAEVFIHNLAFQKHYALRSNDEIDYIGLDENLETDKRIGGFHLTSRLAGNENIETIDKIAEYLMDTKAKYYTCHCTGIEPYKQLNETMGESVDYLKAGSIITI